MPAMPDEAPLRRTPGGLVPEGAGWFILNARDAVWSSGEFGAFTRFEGEAGFPLVGVNIGVLQPGQPACYYHAENEQENFLVLYGECLLLIEGQERPLRAWDFVHSPPWTEHVFIGAGQGPCAILALGSRLSREVVYPESELARRHRAGVVRETRDPDVAYADLADDVETPYQAGWLPDA
jgi:uncharacterized cupin superfamily protein